MLPEQEVSCLHVFVVAADALREIGRFLGTVETLRQCWTWSSMTLGLHEPRGCFRGPSGRLVIQTWGVVTVTVTVTIVVAMNFGPNIV